MIDKREIMQLWNSLSPREKMNAIKFVEEEMVLEQKVFVCGTPLRDQNEENVLPEFECKDFDIIVGWEISAGYCKKCGTRMNPKEIPFETPSKYLLINHVLQQHLNKILYDVD